MGAAVVAKKKMGRPAGTARATRAYGTVKIDKALIPILKMIAARRGVTLADLVSDLLHPLAEELFAELVRSSAMPKGKG